MQTAAAGGGSWTGGGGGSGRGIGIGRGGSLIGGGRFGSGGGTGGVPGGGTGCGPWASISSDMSVQHWRASSDPIPAPDEMVVATAMSWLRLEVICGPH
jgi:hypothetical protein